MRFPVRTGLPLVAACFCAQAQWINQPIAGAPRTPDGKVNMTGPAPRINGKADLSGVWQVEAEPRGQGLFGLGESPNSKYFRDILSDFKPGEEPLTLAGAEILRQHSQPGAFNPTLNCLPDGTPHADLLPEPFKIIQTPREIVMLYEVETTFRQIFTDGRKQLTDPSPSWMGYSVGKWEGDTLVIDVTGLNDQTWFDRAGNFHSDALHVVERYTPRSADTMMYEATIEDSKTFSRPWKISMPLYRHVEKGARLMDFKCVEFSEEFMYGHLRRGADQSKTK
jgi:hypothetical protein